MERVSRNGEASQLADFIAKEREWLVKRLQEQSHGPPPPEDKALELKLGPPGGEDQSNKDFTMNYNIEKHESLLSLAYFNGGNQAQAQNFAPYVQFSPSVSQTQLPVLAEDISSEKLDLQNNNDAEKKRAFSPASAVANTAVPNSSQKSRTAPAPVVGWPPLRTFRKNLASGDGHGKPAPKTHQNVVSGNIVGEKPADSSGKGLFVKMNMDGVPIGRKVDLNSYDSYQKLSAAVDELFRGLLAAQSDSSGCGIKDTQEEEKPITGLLDGRGEYTLVYEDYEGDRMLVGDVPWQMFVSTVKRLRVLKSSDISVLSAGGQKQDKMSSDSAMR